VYFKVTDSYYTESAAYALVVLLKLLNKRRKPLSVLLEPLRGRYHQSGEINIEIADKEEVLREIERRYREAGGRIGKLDGVSVDFPDYWFNVRPSNTEPLIRLRLEAVSREVAEQRTEELVGFLKGFA
jgi:phosphomannomutase